MMKQNQKLFDAVRECDLPIGQYLITGSGPMGIRGLRKINDIDLLVSDKLWGKLAKQYGITEKNGIKKIVIGEIEAFGSESFPEEAGISVAKRLADAEIIEGLPFESLEHAIMFKQMQGRDKDLRDIDLLTSYQTDIRDE